jgi:hypothetical protein
MCDVLHRLGAHSFSREVGESLYNQLREARRLHEEAYPEDGCVPKWHFAIHTILQLLTRGVLWGCWALERKHKDFKQLATPMTNTSSFEKTISLAMINKQLHSFEQETALRRGSFLIAHQTLRHAVDIGGLVFPAGARLASGASRVGERAYRGDFIFLDDQSVAMVHAFLQLDEIWMLVQDNPLIRQTC